MAKRKHLINVHTSTGTTAPTGASLYLGEIAVQHKATDPALWIKVGAAESSTQYEKFVGENAVTSAISQAVSSSLTGVSMNGSQVGVTNKVATLGTVITAETQLSTATTGTGNVVGSIAVSNHKITATMFSAASADQISKLSGATTAHTANTTMHVTSTERTRWNNAWTSGVSAYTKVEALSAATTGISSNLNKLSAGTISLVASSAVTVFSSAKTYTDNEIGKLDSTGQTSDANHYLTSVTITNGIITAVGEEAVPSESSITTATSGGGNVISNITATGHQLTLVKSVTAATSAQVSTLSAATHSHITNGDIHVTAAQKTNWTNSGTSGANAYVGYIAHSANTGIHVTTAEKNTWNGKQDKIDDLSTIRNNALSGASAYTRVDALSAATTAHTADTTAHVTANDKTKWNAAITGVTSAGTGNSFTEYSVANNILTLKKGATYLTTAATTTQGGYADSALQIVSGSAYIDMSAKSGGNGVKMQTATVKQQGVETASATGQGLADAYDVKQYVESLVTSSVNYKGATATLPTSSTQGDMYITTAQIVLTASQSATGAAQTAETGDFIIARSSGKWDVIQKNLDGAITGSLTADTVTIGSGTHTAKSLANGSNGQVLAVVSNKPAWTSAVKVNSATTADSATNATNATNAVSATTSLSANVATNATKVNNHTVNSDVPSNAVFTDTKVTAVGNHYTATTATKTGGTTTGTAASAIKGITYDAAGHIVGVTTGSVLTGETQLSTATTGTGNVVCGLTVSNHKITTLMFSAAPADALVALSAATTAHTANTTAHITSTERTRWNNAWTSGVSAYTKVEQLSAGTLYELKQTNHNIPYVIQSGNTYTGATYEYVAETDELTELVDGQSVIFHPKQNSTTGTTNGSASTCSLSIKLADGTTTTPRPIYLGKNAKITTHIQGCSDIKLTYHDNATWSGVTGLCGWWVDFYYADGNTVPTQLYGMGVVKSDAAFARYALAMQTSAGTWNSVVTSSTTATTHTATTKGFLVGSDMVYYSANLAANTNGAANNGYVAVSSFDFRYSSNAGSTLTSGLPVYLVGTINQTDGLFYLDSTTWWSQTLPTTENGKVYIYVGNAVSNYQVALHEEHPIYEYKGGHVRLYQEDSSSDISSLSAATTAINASMITGITAGGSNVAVTNKVAAIPSASTNTFGVVKAGSFLTSTNGTLSVNTGTSNTTVAVGNHTHSNYATTTNLNALSAATTAHTANNLIHVTRTTEHYYDLLNVQGLYEEANAQSYALPGSDYAGDGQHASDTIILADTSLSAKTSHVLTMQLNGTQVGQYSPSANTTINMKVNGTNVMLTSAYTMNTGTSRAALEVTSADSTTAAFGKVSKVIYLDELITSSALNDLNDRVYGLEEGGWATSEDLLEISGVVIDFETEVAQDISEINERIDSAITGNLSADTVTLGSGTHTAKSLANGSNGQVLSISNNKPAWVNAALTDTATTQGGHYTPSASASTKGTTAATTNFVKGIRIDSKNHVIDVVTGTVITAQTSITTANGTTGNAAAAVITGITTGGTAGHQLTLTKSNKIFSASTSDSALTVTSAITSLSAQTAILGPAYTYSGLPYVNSATSIAAAYSALTNELLADEKVAAASMNDLNSRINELSGSTGGDASSIMLTGYHISCGSTEAELTVAETDSVNDAFGKIQKQMLDNEEAIAASLNDLNARISSVATSGLPAVTSSDNGKILRVVNGQWALVTPTTVLTGSGAPSQSLGVNGDIYLQS